MPTAKARRSSGPSMERGALGTYRIRLSCSISEPTRLTPTRVCTLSARFTAFTGQAVQEA